MARKKNALREHFVADYKPGEKTPDKESFHQLARFITEMTDESDDQTDEFADYYGDGTLREEVIGLSESWTATGFYDSEDEAQTLIIGKKRKFGDDRKLWHMIQFTDGTTVLGVATASAIVGGGGAAEEHEEFSVTLTFDEVAKEVDPSTFEPAL